MFEFYYGESNITWTSGDDTDVTANRNSVLGQGLKVLELTLTGGSADLTFNDLGGGVIGDFIRGSYRFEFEVTAAEEGFWATSGIGFVDLIGAEGGFMLTADANANARDPVVDGLQTTTGGTGQFGFQTVDVPEPASLMLLGSGLLFLAGAMGINRRGRRLNLLAR